MCENSCGNGLLRGTSNAENVVGHYAVSLAGHDAGEIYLVIGIVREGRMAGGLLLCNGKNRTFKKPKTKKRKHVSVLKDADAELAQRLKEGQKVDDSHVIRSLKEKRRSFYQ